MIITEYYKIVITKPNRHHPNGIKQTISLIACDICLRQRETIRSNIKHNPRSLCRVCTQLSKKRTQESIDKQRKSLEKTWTKEKREERSKMYSGEGNPRFIKDREKVWLKQKLREICKTMLCNFLKGKCKKGKTRDILGYSPEEFKNHIEILWEHWMNWGNYGHHSTESKKVWNIDHIKPISKFAEEGVFDPRIVNALSNLRPLEATLNYQKNNNYPARLQLL